MRRRPPALLEVYERLLAGYGPQHWWPAESRFEVIVGAILTQAVGWSNVERAVTRLKTAAALTPAALQALPVEELAALIRPAGYFNAKARKLKAFMAHLQRHYANDLEALLAGELETLRPELLSIYGIGPETADSIILYAADKPVFVVDAYTRRLLLRLGWESEAIADYEALRAVFERHLPSRVPLFQEYHALIVRHGKSTCRKTPRCAACPLLALCAYGRHATGSD